MAYLFPVHKILAVIKRNSGEILETARHQIVIVPDAANARIGIESFYYRIGISEIILCKAHCNGHKGHDSGKKSFHL